MKRARRRDRGRTPQRVKRTGLLLAAGLVVTAGFTAVTQWTARTPAIEGGIAELVQVELNGRREWVSIRGQSAEKPVLLFLAGGPGGSQMAATRFDLAGLEEHFVVVGWDQPGSAKSYSAMRRDDLTPEVYAEDGYALAQYLCERFGQEKIVLVGESWGSALGVMMASAHPELYHAVIGTGQMVAFEETEVIDYELALALAREAGDSGTVATLEGNGPPPYYGKDVTWKSAAYLNYLSGVMAHDPDIHNAGYNTLRDLAAAEYGIVDSVNYLRGIVNTFNHVYPQLYPVDLRADYPALEVPAYFFLGRHDINAPLSLAEDYYELLDAPHKEIVWFEHSGHSPWINESEKFVQEVVRVAGAQGS